jgi:hypothetical protein
LLSIGDWKVPVKNPNGQVEYAILGDCSDSDLVQLPSSFGFSWSHINTITDPDWQQITKISYEEKIQGLIRYEIQPQPEVEDPEDIPGLNHELIVVLHLEATQGPERLVEPLGKWLIWYAAKVASQVCSGTKNGILIGLIAIPSARAYYEDKVGMSNDGPTKLSNGSPGYAFSFNQQQAEQFCNQQEQRHGSPIQV